MSWAEWQINGAVGGMQAVGSFIQKSRQAKSDRAWQKYNNTMTRIQNGVNQNNITTNQNMALERKVRESFNLRVAKYQTEAKAEVAAAAVGAEGNSVDMVMRDIQQNESRMQANLDKDFEYQRAGFQQQRQSSALQTEMQIDYRQIPKPSIAQDLLKWGAETGTEWWKSKL